MIRAAVTRLAFAFAAIGAVALVAVASGACNDQGDCPAKESIAPGAACSDDQLQCAYDLATPSAACDGTSTTIASSCICTKGAWSCPSAYSCEAGPADGGDEGGTDEGGSGEGGGEAGDDGGGSDAPAVDAPSDAPQGG
jgi:hypothetical protein